MKNWTKDIGLLIVGALLGAVFSYVFGYRDAQTQLRLLKGQQAMLESLLKQVATVDHDVHLDLDARGHVIGGYVVGVGHATEGNDNSGAYGGTAEIKPQP